MRIQYGQLVGKIGNEYYVLNDTFIHNGNFKGATGAILVPITNKEYEERMTFESVKERYEDIWEEQVHSGCTDQGLDDWINDLMINISVDNMFDTSYYRIGEIVAEIYNSELPEDTPDNEKAEFCECVGCGRIFTKNMVFDKVYNQELIEEINKFEESYIQ